MGECNVSRSKSSDKPSTEENVPPRKLPQIWAALTASIGYFICGNIIGWSGSALTKMDKDFEMDANEYSLVASLFSYGGLVGSFLSGKMMDALGRRKIMLATCPIAACGWAVIGFSTNVYLVYVGRFVCGLATGFLLNSCSIYTTETCQASLRGRLGSLSSLNMTIGILTAYLLSGFFAWRTSAFLLVIPAVVFFVNLYMVPESPYWYLLKGRFDEATQSMTKLRGKKYDTDKEMKDMIKKISDIGTISYCELLKKRTLLPLVIALFIQTIQQVSGANVIIMYSSTIYEKAESSIDAQMATIYTGIAQVIGTVISMFIIDKYGRRILLTVSAATCGIFVTLLGAYFYTLSTGNPWPTWTPLLILFAYIWCYGLGCRSIPWLIGSEMFNSAVRSRANSVIVFYNRALHLIVIQVYPHLVQSFGNSTVFFAYGVLCPLYAVGTLLFVPETKGKTLEQMQDYFEKKTSSKKDKDAENSITQF
ncbi:UNVERIFIED_CONTAM: hypothetical protein RMT77_015833 [Armadillidium vulgare]